MAATAQSKIRKNLRSPSPCVSPAVGPIHQQVMEATGRSNHKIFLLHKELAPSLEEQKRKQGQKQNQGVKHNEGSRMEQYVPWLFILQYQ